MKESENWRQLSANEALEVPEAPEDQGIRLPSIVHPFNDLNQVQRKRRKIHLLVNVFENRKPVVRDDLPPDEDGSEEHMKKFLMRVQSCTSSMECNASTSGSDITISQSSSVETQLLEIVKVLAENQSYNRLPVPEPGIFRGDSLQYPSWIRAFETLIESKAIRPDEKIHFLRKYVAGEAREAIDGLMLLNSEDAYQKTKEMLSKRFGDSFVVANAYRQRLDSWPKIQAGDAKGMRKYADFLVHCEKAMESISSLRVLNDDQENRKMITRLPKWIINRWSREVYRYKEEHQLFPPFSEFVKFLVKEADILCDPVTSFQSPSSEVQKKPKDMQKSTRSMIELRSKGYEATKTFTTSSQDSRHSCNPCLMCKASHEIDNCKAFLKKSVQDRKMFAMSNRLCFGCLKQGHRSKECPERKTCQICSKSHPSSLHGDIKSQVQAKSNEDEGES